MSDDGHLAFDRNHPVRVGIRNLVEQELRNRHPLRVDWQNKCPEMALQLEEVMLKLAKTLEEYSNKETIFVRLAQIAAAKRKSQLKTSPKLQYDIISILNDANERWLNEHELYYLFSAIRKSSPSNVVRFHPSPGGIYHVGSFSIFDGIEWENQLGSALLKEIRSLLSIGGKPRIWQSHCVDKTQNMHRRIYWLVENTGGLLVHYRNSKILLKNHSETCTCLLCSIDQATSSALKRVKQGF